MKGLFAHVVKHMVILLLTMYSRAASAQEWTLIPGAARDVGVGANGAAWIVGDKRVAGGYSVARWTGGGWTQVPGAAQRIAVDPSGNAWVVNDRRRIFHHTGSAWEPIDGVATDIGVGADGSVWIIGTNAVSGGFGIYRRTGTGWTNVPGGAVRITVDSRGNAWVVKDTNEVLRFNGKGWDSLPGSMVDIGAGAEGSVWATGTDGGIYRWNRSKWARQAGVAVNIAAGPPGVVWVVNKVNAVYRSDASTPTTVASGQVVNIGPAPVVTRPTATGTITLQGDPIDITVPSTPAKPATPQQQQLQVTGGPVVFPAGSRVGPVGTSTISCGVPGKGLCRSVAAVLEGNADLSCPSGAFPDLGRSACFQCPEGFTRSGHAVDDYKACQKADPSVRQAMVPATYRGPLCGEGTFYDVGTGDCYSCPAGYNRSAAPIDAVNACFVPAREVFSRPTHHKQTLWPHECSSGTFWDGYNGGNCYSCPNGYQRTAHAISDSKACATTVGEQHARASLIKKAQCADGEIRDDRIQGTQNSARGGGCWTCPSTDRTIFPIDGPQACERAPGVRWASATRVRGMTCEPEEIFDAVSSAHPGVARALAARNAAKPASAVKAKALGGTCWSCPSGFKRNGSAVFSGAACDPPGIAWKSAPYNQPGLFGLRGAEAVALQLVTDRTVINRIIRDLRASGSVKPDIALTAWDEIGTRPQESAILAMAVFSRVVAAAADPARATADERALLEDTIEQIRLFRVFTAQNGLDAYLAWKGGQEYRKNQYARSQLQVMTDTGEVPPDFEAITAESIMASLGATVAVNTAIYLTMSSETAFKALFPFAARAIVSRLAAAAVTGTVPQAVVTSATSSAGAALSTGPQIIITFGMVVLQVAIEQQIAIANAERKLNAGLTNAKNSRIDFRRLMATPEGSAQAQSQWAMLMAGPAPRADGTRPPMLPPNDLTAFAKHAAAAKRAVVTPSR
jgi:Tectonin domain